MTTLRDLVFGIVPLVASGAALAQNGNMMNGGSWGGGWMGGSGGTLLPVLLVAVLIGIVVLVVRRK